MVFLFQIMKLNNKHYLIIFFVILTCIFVYFPGLNGGFYFDDTANIEDNELLHIEQFKLEAFWQAMWSGQAGLLKRPIAMLTFALDHYFFGLNPFAMKTVNLFIHLVNGLLLLSLMHLLFTNLQIASQKNKNIIITSLVVFAVWLIHPINLTNVLYVVQRMNSLATFFTLLSIISYCLGRCFQLQNSGHWFLILFACPFFALLALLCKENAILIPYFILCIEFFILKFRATNNFTRVVNKTLVYSSAIIPIIFCIVFFTLNFEWLSNWYENRDFTLTERLLTQTRIIVWYIQMIIMPNISQMGLFVEISPLSTSLLQPINTLASILFLFGLIISAFLCKAKLPLFSFGISWFFVGHLLESTFIPLELIFEHRNYLPSFGLILAIVALAEIILSHVKKLRLIRFVLTLAWFMLLSYSTYARATHWENSFSLALHDVENHPHSSRSNVYAGLVYTQAAIGSENPTDKNNFAKQADEYFLRAIEYEKNGLSSSIGRLIILFLLREPIKDEFIKQLRNNLATKNIDASTQSALSTLIDCQIANVCLLKDDVLTDLMSTNNPSLNYKNRASLLIALSEYYIKSKNDPLKAIELTNEAISADPEKIRYRLVLVNWFIQSDNYNKAKIQLEELKQLDKFKFHKYDIDRWETVLSDSINSNTDTIN